MPIREKCVVCGDYEWVNPSATEWGKILFVCLTCRFTNPNWEKIRDKLLL
jgi:hypothetical protein